MRIPAGVSMKKTIRIFVCSGKGDILSMASGRKRLYTRTVKERKRMTEGFWNSFRC
jgi:hypothetical protein